FKVDSKSMQKRTHHEPTKHTAVTNSTCHEATAGGRREAPQHPPTNVTARATKPDAIQRARPREATKPTTTCPANRNYRERATTQRRICKWFDIVGSRHYRQCDRALMTSRHESTSPRGFVALEGSKFGITPRGKLRACPCSGPSAPLYESRPASGKQPCQPDSCTGYFRQIGSTCAAASAVKLLQPARQINLHSRTSHVRHWDLTLHGGWPLACALAEFRCHPVTPIRTKL